MAILELPDIAPVATGGRHGETDYAEVHLLLHDPEPCMTFLEPNLATRQANPEFMRRFGGPPADVCGNEFQTFVHSSVRNPPSREFSRSLEQKLPMG
ncbi:hypothetical protein [Nonomuraea sp. NPDC049480]|uniref:hypothetical protein n=1 Tax=Nonomuraea sp. NPDC049480 TaxID=3364353 RepID=UPI0037A5713E